MHAGVASFEWLETSEQLCWELRGEPGADLDGFLIAMNVSPDGPHDPVSDLLPTGPVVSRLRTQYR